MPRTFGYSAQSPASQSELETGPQPGCVRNRRPEYSRVNLLGVASGGDGDDRVRVRVVDMPASE